MQITGDTEKVPQETRMFLPVVLVYAIFAQKSTFAFTRGARRERLVPFTGADGVPPQSRPTRPAQGPSAEGPGALTGRFASLRARGLRPALTDSAAPHGGTSPPMYPPALRGSLEGKARSTYWGRRPVKFRSSLFKGLGEAHVPEGTRSGPLGLGEPRGAHGLPIKNIPVGCF